MLPLLRLHGFFTRWDASYYSAWRCWQLDTTPQVRPMALSSIIGLADQSSGNRYILLWTAQGKLVSNLVSKDAMLVDLLRRMIS